MANSPISSLGIGSQGVLSYDKIDKLKKVDESATITPIDNKITQNKTQSNDLAILTTMTASLKSASSALSDETSYLGRSVTSSDEGISVSAEAGSEVQDFSFNATQLAKRDIYQSKSFTNTTDTFATGNDTVTINIGGKDYSIGVDASTKLNDFKDKIYDATDGKVIASILNVGGDTPYKLILKSTDTGASNAMTISSTGDAVSNLGIADDTTSHIQHALDLKATFNGVSITRSSNSVDDLITGVTIKANKEVSSNVSIKQDTSTISDSLQNFVDKYNNLINNLNESTKYNPETKASGTFQGTSEIKNLKNDVATQLFQIDPKGRNLSEYGITLNSTGLLEFDKSAFDSKMSTDNKDVENFFRGDSNNDGFFTKYNDMLSGYIKFKTGTLSQLNTQLTDEKKSLTENKTKATERLDAKYNILTTKFRAYDAIISKFNASFQSLSMQISAAVNGTNN